MNFKRVCILATLTVLVMLTLCSCGQTQSVNGTSRIQKEITSIDPPQYMNASYPPFDISTVMKEKSEFIFRGRIESIKEYQIQYLDTNKVQRGPYYFSVCVVSIHKIMYGALEKETSTVRVVSTQSSHMMDTDAYQLKTGSEYYFITHIFNEEDKTRHIVDPDNHLMTYSLGDVQLYDDRYRIMPIESNYVKYQKDWPINGSVYSEKVSDDMSISGKKANVSAFELELTNLINSYKGK